MGCSGAHSSRNNQFLEEATGFEKKKVGGLDLDKNKEETKSFKAIGNASNSDLNFIEELIGHGDESGVVKPWLENIVSPDYEVQEDLDYPKYDLKIEHIFGYRIEDCRQNLFFFGKEELLYMCGSLGIIQNIDDNSQTLFGGFFNKGDKECHDNDIMSLSFYKGSVSMVATGQRGLKPIIFVWSPHDTSVVYAKFVLPKGTKEVSSLEFDAEGRYLVATAKDENNSIFIFDLQTKSLYDQKPTNEIKSEKKEYLFDTTAHDETNEFCVVGVNKIFFLNVKIKSMSKNKYKSKGDDDICIFTCAYFVGDMCIVGNDRGEIWKFYEKARDEYHIQSVSSGSIQNITYANYPKSKKVYISDSKCNVLIFDDKLKQIGSFTMESVVKALDANEDDQIAMGLKNGSIVIKNFKDKTKREDILLNSHCEGSIRGLDYVPENRCVTAGDDNKILVWNLRSKKCESEGQINNPWKIQSKDGNQVFHPSCRATCVAYNIQKGHIAIGLADGKVTIREGIKKLEERVVEDILIINQNYTENTEKQQNQEENPEKEEELGQEITDMKFTPNGAWLMVSAQSGELVLLDVNDDYKEIIRYPSDGTKPTDYIKVFDWDSTTSFIQAITNKNKFIFLNASDKDISEVGKKLDRVRDLDWPSLNCKFGFTVQGVYLGSTDPNFISSVCKAHSKGIIVAGNDDKLLNLYNYPCISENPKLKSFRGHSGHINKIVFSSDDEKIITIAEDDKAVIIWNVVDY